ncbi:hypothetical protein [Roseivivax sp. CAU 1761]
MPLPYAALLVPRAVGVDPLLFLPGMAEVLERLDLPPHGSAIRSAALSAAAGASLIVRVETELQPGQGGRVTFRMAPRPGQATPSRERAVRILAQVVLRAMAVVEAREVEWLAPGVLLRPDEFHTAQSYVSPRRTRAAPAIRAPSRDDEEHGAACRLARLIDDQKLDAAGPAEPPADTAPAARPVARLRPAASPPPPALPDAADPDGLAAGFLRTVQRMKRPGSAANDLGIAAALARLAR